LLSAIPVLTSVLIAFAAPVMEGRVHAFYYPWWGNTATDGAFRHWNHEVLTQSPQSAQYEDHYPGGKNIGASFYPLAGCYSSQDSVTVCSHFDQMQQAGIDVAAVSWWGRDSFEDRAIPLLLDCAHHHDIAVAIHLEPYPERSAFSTREDLIYLQQRYGQHPAWYREAQYGDRPLYYLYDSYNIPASEWARLLQPSGDITVRDTEHDAIFINLLVEADDCKSLLEAGFDGLYTYFGATGFSYGSTPVNWQGLSDWANEQNLLFIPCVAPGYDDVRVRPWNGVNTRLREQGAYYDRLWSQAVAADPDGIGITSFNEWHEGTQIEPARPLSITGYTYEDYLPLTPEFYLQRTRYWSDRYRECILKGGGHIAAECLLELREAENVEQHYGRSASIGISSPPDERYPGQGDLTLLDGRLAEATYRDGRWLGFNEQQLLVDIDLGQETTVSECQVGFLSQQSAWIFLPVSFQVAVSIDGERFENVIQYATVKVEQTGVPARKEYGGCITPIRARYIRIITRALPACPEWHAGAGEVPWIFVDEIVIK
jgi:hypothetical protein